MPDIMAFLESRIVNLKNGINDSSRNRGTFYIRRILMKLNMITYEADQNAISDMMTFFEHKRFQKMHKIYFSEGGGHVPREMTKFKRQSQWQWKWQWQL